MTDKLDPFALGGRQDDAELVQIEQELWAARAELDSPLTDSRAHALANRTRELERRINETTPKTAAGVAVKLRQILDAVRNGHAEADEADSLEQLIEFVSREEGADA